jgi:hypothetical protein
MAHAVEWYRPKFFIVRDHEVASDPLAERIRNPIKEIVAVDSAPRFGKAKHAFPTDVFREPMNVILEWIRHEAVEHPNLSISTLRFPIIADEVVHNAIEV